MSGQQATHSASQLQADQLLSESFESELGVASGTTSASGRGSDANLNRFGGNSVLAQTARQAGRLNAASISKEEEASLNKERQNLLDKKFAGTITRSEENRLQYVRWSLDRIDDAREGLALDRLENMISQYENLAADIRALSNEIERASRRK